MHVIIARAVDIYIGSGHNRARLTHAYLIRSREEKSVLAGSTHLIQRVSDEIVIGECNDPAVRSYLKSARTSPTYSRAVAENGPAPSPPHMISACAAPLAKARTEPARTVDAKETQIYSLNLPTLYGAQTL